MKGAEVVICGGGIIGLAIARELLRYGLRDIIILEKEEGVGRHASGRNSGVLHAGIYYPPGSLKARLCVEGNHLMKEYCREKGLSLLETGKVIVARDDGELERLEELYRRAVANGARVELISERDLQRIEPMARTTGTALYCQDTAVIDPAAILNGILGELRSSRRVRVLTGTAFLGVSGKGRIRTTGGEIDTDLFINAAGTYSDRVAHAFGVGREYRLLPFKGIYRRLRGRWKGLVRGNIYPLPEPGMPFLGVHITKGVDGEVYVGPTAMPALGRENYGILRGMDREVLSILWHELGLFLSDSGFRGLALREMKKYIDRYLYRDAGSLIVGLKMEDLEPSGKVGIRGQLFDIKRKELVSDFLVIREGWALHILNAVSPAFTSSLAFAGFVVREHILKGNGKGESNPCGHKEG